jgi:hypothetical protein
MPCWFDCNSKRSMDYIQKTEDKREKIHALSLAKQCYSMKLDLLTNATVVDDAIRFLSEKFKEKLKSSANSNEGDKEESNGPDYDEYEQEGQIGEITTTTTKNHVFLIMLRKIIV